MDQILYKTKNSTRLHHNAVCQSLFQHQTYTQCTMAAFHHTLKLLIDAFIKLSRRGRRVPLMHTPHPPWTSSRTVQDGTDTDVMTGSTMVMPDFDSASNVVEWVLSGNYDATTPVLIDAGNAARFITKQKAMELIASLAGAFPRDSTVCLHLVNDITYPVLTLAILASGGRWTGTNPAVTEYELAHHFRISDTSYVITSTEHLETVEKAIHMVQRDIEVILYADLVDTSCQSFLRTSEKPVSRRTVLDLLSRPDFIKLEALLRAISPEDLASLHTTSGTTGLPKMAARSHKALVAETQAIENNDNAKTYPVRRLYCTPIFHAFSTPVMMYNSIRLGYPTYIMKRFDSTFAQKVYDFAITETAAPPPMLAQLQQQTENHELLQSLRLIHCGGSALLQQQRCDFLDIFRIRPLCMMVWGMTEGGWFTTTKYPENDETGSVGRAVPGIQIRVHNEQPMTLADGKLAGELQVKGPQLMEGYLGNAKESRAAFTDDGWLKTGDIGWISDQGLIYIVDRAKDLIKVNGWQVAPAELESALSKSADVQDAAAIAVGHDVGEHPMLFIVPKHDQVTAQGIEQHLRKHLARYKVAKIEVRFVESIPRNPTGKILRKVLRALLEEEE